MNRTIILSCERDHVSVRVHNISSGAARIRIHKVRDHRALLKLLERIKLNEKKDVVMCSSSMDFPLEYTRSKKVLALVQQIRGTSVQDKKGKHHGKNKRAANTRHRKA